MIVIISTPICAGTTICLQNDSVAIILDPSIPELSHGVDKSVNTWWTQFPYGRISGISACLDKKLSATFLTETKSTYTSNQGEEKLVKGGEKYGQYCWCKITHPVSSLWLYHRDYGNKDTCISNCLGNCSWHIGDTYDMRSSILKSI